MESGHISVTGKEKERAETMNVLNLQTYLHNFHMWLMTAITQQNRTGMKPKTHPIFLWTHKNITKQFQLFKW